MWLSNDFLQQCEQLFQLGYRPTLQPGMLVGRGFADVGCEVFSLLPTRKLVSLISGDVSELRPEEEEKFFHVPGVDDCLAEIDRLEWDVVELGFENNREWRLSLAQSGTRDAVQLRNRSLPLLLLRALAEIFQVRSSS